MKLVLEPIVESEFEDLFVRIKEGIFPYVDAVFGWEDAFQRQRLENEYQLDWFYWVKVEKDRVGVLCYKRHNASCHVHWLIVFPEWWQRNIGTSIMAFVQKKARENGCTAVTLSSFKCNANAIQFYQGLGYVIIEEEEDFVSMFLSLAAS